MTKWKWLGAGCAVLSALALLPILGFMVFFDLGKEEKPRFVEVPEVTGLSSKIQGHLLINRGWDSSEPNTPALVAYSFPERRESIVRAIPGQYLDMSRISGPAHNGDLVFVKSSGMAGESRDRWYSLNAIHIDGTKEREIFKRSGDLLWEHPMGEIALSPTNRLVAFIGPGQSVQYPGAYLKTGTIEIWDTAKSTGYVTMISALDEPLWWLPDGNRLIYATVVDRSTFTNTADLPGSPLGATGEKEFGRWEQYPAACIFDLATGEFRVLLPGWNPLLSYDGKSLLTQNGDQWLLLNIETGKIISLTPPSHWNYPEILFPGNLAAFAAPPKVGTPPRWLKRGSFKAGSQMWSLKVGSLESWEMETIIPYPHSTSKCNTLTEGFRRSFESQALPG